MYLRQVTIDSCVQVSRSIQGHGSSLTNKRIKIIIIIKWHNWLCGNEIIKCFSWKVRIHPMWAHRMSNSRIPVPKQFILKLGVDYRTQPNHSSLISNSMVLLPSPLDSASTSIIHLHHHRKISIRYHYSQYTTLLLLHYHVIYNHLF